MADTSPSTGVARMTDKHLELSERFALGLAGEAGDVMAEIAALVRSLRDGTRVVVDVDDLSELDALLVRAKLTTECPSPTRDHVRSALAIVRGWLSRQPSQQAQEQV